MHGGVLELCRTRDLPVHPWSDGVAHVSGIRTGAGIVVLTPRTSMADGHHLLDAVVTHQRSHLMCASSPRLEQFADHAVGCSYIPLTNSPQPWQVLFICVGGITFLWGILMYFTLPDSPVSAWWLTDRQRCIAVMRLRKNQTGVENKRFKWYQARESLLDLKTWLPFFINLCVNVPSEQPLSSPSLTR